MPQNRVTRPLSAVLANRSVPGDRQTCTISRTWDERLPSAFAPGDVPILPLLVPASTRPLVPGRVQRISALCPARHMREGAKRCGLRVCMWLSLTLAGTLP